MPSRSGAESRGAQKSGLEVFGKRSGVWESRPLECAFRIPWKSHKGLCRLLPPLQAGMMGAEHRPHTGCMCTAALCPLPVLVPQTEGRAWALATVDVGVALSGGLMSPS